MCKKLGITVLIPPLRHMRNSYPVAINGPVVMLHLIMHFDVSIA